MGHHGLPVRDARRLVRRARAPRPTRSRRRSRRRAATPRHTRATSTSTPRPSSRWAAPMPSRSWSPGRRRWGSPTSCRTGRGRPRPTQGDEAMLETIATEVMPAAARMTGCPLAAASTPSRAMPALAECLSAGPDLGDLASVPRPVVATAVRYALEELADAASRAGRWRCACLPSAPCSASRVRPTSGVRRPTSSRPTPPPGCASPPGPSRGRRRGRGPVRASGLRADLSGVLPLAAL